MHRLTLKSWNAKTISNVVVAIKMRAMVKRLLNRFETPIRRVV